MHNHSYENEFNLHVNEISFSYEKMGTKTRFEEEAKCNSEMAYLQQIKFRKVKIASNCWPLLNIHVRILFLPNCARNHVTTNSNWSIYDIYG